MKPSAILLGCCAATLVVVAVRELRPSPMNAAATYKVKSLVVHGPYLLSAEEIGGLPPVILTEARDEPAAVEQSPVTFTEVPPSSGRRAPRPTSDPFTPSGLEQYDAQVAASDGYLILATGHNLVFYGKDGHPLESKLSGNEIGVITTAQFFGNAQMQQDIKNSLNLPPQYASLNAATYIDLRVRFDHYRKRFWLISEWNNKNAYSAVVEGGDGFARYARRNRIVAGVSKTQDPRDGFWLYWWEGAPDDGACNDVPDGTRLELCPRSDFAPGDASDFPYLGFSADHAVQTIHYNNMWPRVLNDDASAISRGVVANLLPADVMAGGDRVLSAWSYWDIKNHFGEQVISLILPADGHPLGDPGDRGYLARLVRKPDVADPASNLFLNYWSISSGNPPTLSSSIAPITASAFGGGALPQPGTTDLVPVSSAYHTVFRNGRLYLPFTEHAPLVAGVDGNGNPTTWTRVRFIGVGTGSSAVEIDRTLDVSDAGQGSLTAKGFPELQVNKHGDVAVAYMAAGLPNVRQGAYYSVYYPASDELTERRTLHAGEGIIPAGKNDVDHGGTALDPADNESIWMAHFYATSAGNYGYVVGKVFGTTLADLFSKGISLSTDTVRPGGEFTIRIRLGNQGDGHTIGTRATVYLSADDAISSDDRAIEEVTIPAIQSGHERVIELRVRLPRDIPEGAYSIAVDLDPDRRLREYLVDNNTSTRNPRLRVLR